MNTQFTILDDIYSGKINSVPSVLNKQTLHRLAIGNPLSYINIVDKTVLYLYSAAWGIFQFYLNGPCNWMFCFMLCFICKICKQFYNKLIDTYILVYRFYSFYLTEEMRGKWRLSTLLTSFSIVKEIRFYFVYFFSRASLIV